MEALRQNHNKIISLKKAKKLVILLIFALCMNFLFFSLPVLASAAKEVVDIVNISEPVEQTDIIIEEPKIAVKSVSTHTATAYNSDPAQTDNTPCITANGFNVCKHGVEDTIAANFLPFGAKVRMPELYGDRVFVVRDRMNSRYTSRVDIWMLKKTDARKFGVQKVVIEVLE
jgi:3D (Asp-Asp-Asp) domain-containing protein